MKATKTAAAAILAVALPLFPFAAVASDEVTKDEFCNAIGAMGASIMERRQAGVPMSSLMLKIENSGSTPEMIKVARAAVMDAYRSPLFTLPEFKQDAIDTFRNTLEFACYETM